MKFKLVFILVIVASGVFSQKKRVTIPLTFTQQYCGGARPTTEMETEAAKQRPYANKTILILFANGKTDSIRTDKDGKLKLKLRKGSYQLYEQWRYNLYTPDDIPIDSFDKECLKTEWQKVLVTLIIGKENTRVIQNYELVKVCPWSLPCLSQSEIPPARQ